MNTAAVRGRMDADTECYQHSMPANQLTYQGGRMATAHNTLVPSAISPVVSTSKPCTKCGVDKPFSEFHKHKNGRFGLRSCCKPCELAASLSYRTHVQSPAQKERRALASVHSNMVQRCYKPRSVFFKYYGGRGITICQRWLDSLDDFISDMGPRPKGYEIDRTNNDGNYTPENCRWVTRAENCQNRRLRCDNKLGITGIVARKGGQYVAQMDRDGATYRKSFTQLWDAICYRKSLEDKFNRGLL